MSWFVLAFATLVVPFAACAVHTPASINSDITLLYYNDLNYYTAPEHKSVLLLDSQTAETGAASCATLGETLLPINETFFLTELVHSLQYLVYEGHYSESQLYWVESSANACAAVDAIGQVAPVPCTTELPVLCSQSSAYGATATATNQLTVNAGDLTITGYRDQLSFRFEGIPYADPPARFTYPTAYTGSSTLNATAFGSECVQAGVPTGSEDCLFLNIWTPYVPQSESVEEAKLKPVLFWIHGGAFTSGTGSDPTFAGGNMASRGDVVVVTINYRLSTLGFLALEDGVTNGNFGIADQIAALEWVNEYITAFGGDPSRITIFGQSAGAGSVRALLQVSQVKGKFAAAVPMSNLAGSNYATTYSLYYTIPEEVYTAVEPILEETNCTLADALECLKAYNAYDLVSLTNVARYIVVDGTYIKYPELPLNGSGTVANVHAMMGFMRDDGAAFIGYPTSGNLTAGLETQYLPTTVVNNSLFVEPAGPNITLDVFNVTARVTSDVEFRCLDQATAWSGVTHDLFQSVWFYEFNRSYQTPGFDPNYPVCDAPVTEEYPYGDPSLEYFKCHSGELYYVFASLPSTLPYRDAEDLPFMQTTLDTWTAFARTYDPNPDPGYLVARGYLTSLEQLSEQEPWTPVTNATLDTTPIRVLQYPSFMGPFGEQAQCDFLGYPLNYFG